MSDNMLEVEVQKDLNSTTGNSINDESIVRNSHLDVEKKEVQDTSEQTSISGNGEIDEKQLSLPEQISPRDIYGWKWIVVVMSILSSIFLFSLDNTIVADVQPAVVETFGDVGKLPWLSVGFLLGAASTNLIWGKIFTIFNGKWAYIGCVVFFEVGSAICGGSNNMNTLIVGRVICGVSGSGMYVGVMTLLSVTTTIQERPLYIGSTGLMWGIGTVLGPIIGGAFTQSSATWRWAFYINLVIGGLFAPVLVFLLPSHDPKPNTSHLSRWKEMDFVGSLLLIGAFVSGILAISFGGILYAWSSGQIIACFVLSAILFTIFGIQQELALFTTPARRIFPVQFLRHRTMVILFACTSCAASGVVVPLYMIPLFFQFTRNDGALDAGVRLLPYIVLMVFLCILNGAALSKYGFYMPWYLFGSIFLIIGAALMYTVTAESSNAAVYGYSALIGIGVGVFVQAGFSVAQGVVKSVEIPEAIGFISMAQLGGISISIAIANSVFLNKAESGIAALLPDASAAEIQSAVTGVGSTLVNSLSADLKVQVLDAIVGAMSKTYIGVIAAGGLVLVLSLFMKRERLFLEAAVSG